MYEGGSSISSGSSMASVAPSGDRRTWRFTCQLNMPRRLHGASHTPQVSAGVRLTDKMREISPATNMSAEEYLRLAPPEGQELVRRIRRQKEEGTRPMPSASLIDCSVLLTAQRRKSLLDRVAVLVDENLFGRAEMCMQFSSLLAMALSHLGLSARTALGKALYYHDGREIFRWDHAWVRIGEEIVDGNVDILFENPMVPPSVNVSLFWGSINDVPRDRRLREDRTRAMPPDAYVSEIWWPELRSWLDDELR